MKLLNLLIFIILSSQTSLANVVGIDAQNFNPTSNGLDFVTVQSSETLAPGVMNFGLFFNYAINTLPNYQDVSTQTRYEPKDTLTSMDLSFGLGLTKNWDIGLTIPQVLSQEVDSNSTVRRGQFENTGLTEIRVNSKYRFFGDSEGGLATVISANWFLIENYPFTGSNPGPTFNLELAYDFTYEDFNFGTNVGYRFRNPGTPITGVPVEPYPDEFLLSFAGSYLVSSIDTKFIAEIFSSLPTKEVQFTSDRELSSAELLLGAKWAVRNDLALHFGMGTELYQGSSSPDWRVYTGINWAIGPLFGRAYEDTPDHRFLEYANFNAPSADETFITKDVLFEFNSTQVNNDFERTLQKLSNYLKAGNGFRTLTIVGHTDSVGKASYNKKLSVQRALSVRRELVKYLDEADRVKVRASGQGEQNPIADNGNYQGRALNRRVEFNIKRDL